MQKSSSVYSDLPQLLHMVGGLGLFDPMALPFCMKFTRNLKIYYHVDDRSGFFVKVYLGDSAEREFRALQAALLRLGDHVPQPLQLVKADSLSTYISPLYHFSPLTYGHFAHGALLDQICELLCYSVVPGNDYPPVHSEQISAEQIKLFALDEGIISSRETGLLSYIDYSFGVVSSINQIPQHCDLTPYNFSIEENKRIFICDWEDFGRISFPGFDLASFILELARMAGLVEQLVACPTILDGPVLSRVAGGLFANADLTLQQWQRLFPFYILLFSYLKKNLGYSMEYFACLRKILRDIFCSELWNKKLTGMTAI